MRPAEPHHFLPATAKEMQALGWERADVILFTGDAYIDHPSFGAAVVGRRLQAAGYRVAIVPQPNWRDDLRDFKKMGEPRLFFGVTAGAMDSMVNHYTAARRLRSDDAYTPGGKAGFRPDRAVTVYTSILKRLFPRVPVVIGGIEASLRRLAHYDYWDDALHPSILAASGADLLAYGMGEGVMEEIARTLHNGFNAKLLRRIRQVAYMADKAPGGAVVLHPFERCRADPRAFAENFVTEETLSNCLTTDTVLAEGVGDRFVVVNPPREPITTAELDASFDLPYMRAPHPRYAGKGDIPAWEMIRFSVNIHRGCFGGCSFCTISAHQGKFVVSRSERSVLAEVEKVTRMPGFKGNLSDLGGPSANMYRMAGRDATICGSCRRPSCLYPGMCRNLDNDHAPLLDLYRKVRGVKGVKKAFIGSGIRYDLFDGGRYLEEVVVNHTSGRLKVAPEHTEQHVTDLMRKPPFAVFERLNRDFCTICDNNGLNYQLIPYFISSYPGCTESDMRALRQKTRSMRLMTDQVQDFTPTPMTLGSVMYHTGMDPFTGRKLSVAKDEDKRRQREYFLRPGASARPASEPSRAAKPAPKPRKR